MKIKVLIPNQGMDRETLNSREKMLSRALASGTEVSVDCIKVGPVSIESNTDEVLAAKELLKEAVIAEKERYDAFVIYCFSDLAIDAIRENVSIPVIGPGEASLVMADMLSYKFSVITTISGNIARTERRLMKNCIAKEKLASVRALDIPVVDLRDDEDMTKKILFNTCKEIIEEDKSQVIILGCLGMADYGDYIQEELGVTVIDPAFTALGIAEMCARLKIKHNLTAYPKYNGGVIHG